jgi:hypothetical protein
MPRAVTLAMLTFFVAAHSAAAQSSNPSPTAPAAQPPDSAKAADEAKSKKVWTNENISSVSGTVSVVGNSKGNGKANSNAGKAADAQYIANTRKQLEKLQTQIDETSKQIADLKNFSKGEPPSSSSGIELDRRYAREPIEVQIRSLEDKKKGLQENIDELLDQARKNGVEPGQLR